MRETFHIISDGSCDLPVSLTQEKNITVVPFYVSFDDQHYLKENVDIDIRDFYQQMVEKKGVYPKSSMPSVQDYEDAFRPFVEAGIPLICICITTKFSGSMQSALNAKALLLEHYPHAVITVIDATINTVLQGQYVLEAAALRDAGFSYQEAITRLEKIKSTGRIFFTVGNMEYLKHGGRAGIPDRDSGRRTGYPPRYHVKERRDLPLRHRPGTKAHHPESVGSPSCLFERKQPRYRMLQYCRRIRL